jgi:hypothetical protein
MTVIGGKVASEQEGSTSGNYCAAFDVGGAWPANALTQTLQTSPGRLYVLNFDTGISVSSVASLGYGFIRHFGLLDETVTPAYSPPAVFQHYQFYFVADSTRHDVAVY